MTIVTGRFRTRFNENCGPPNRRLIAEFVNWPSDAKGILNFTRKYGPLRNQPKEGAAFEFSLFEWHQDQRHFQWAWGKENALPSEEKHFNAGALGLRGHWLTYVAPDLYTFLRMDLLTCDRNRLRFCKRPDCQTPYFVAGHLKQRFCSDTCAAWGQREWKKHWWRTKGQAWRESKKKQ